MTPEAVVYSGGIHDGAGMEKRTIVHSDRDVLGGTLVFGGTRVPVKALYDYLEGGDSLDEFLEDFPSVSREQAVAVLEMGRAMTEKNATVIG